jgi:hypothetical protein
VQGIGSIDADKIISGTTVQGVVGDKYLVDAITVTSGGERYIPAGIHRDKTTAQLKYSQIDTIDPTSTTGYRMRSIITKDQYGLEGTGGAGTYNPSVTLLTVRPNTECGTSAALVTVEDKIADCAAKNSTTSTTWDGTTNGNSSEGIWKLVLRTTDAKEVWQDMRTRLLWSDNLGIANWCRAVGSNDPDDPNGRCNNDSWQPVANPHSWCEEISGFITPANTAKGGLDLSSTPSVKWRLPTAADYHIAAANGIHLVLPNMYNTTNNCFWTASTMAGGDENRAFEFYSPNAQLWSYHVRANTIGVRCVGAVF